MTAAGTATRCFLLTPPGAGAIAVVRLSGPDAVRAAEAVFTPAAGARRLSPQPGRLRLGQVVADGQVLDDALLSLSAGPGGDLFVDLSTHGGVRVVERLLMTLKTHGVTVCEAAPVCEAWPTTSRMEAEAIESAISVRTRRALDFVMRQRRGLPAHIERLAELADSDADAARAGIRRLLAHAERWRVLVEGATVAVIGPPNAGKSTLANRLFGSPRALVSEVAGTTRDWVAEPAAVQGVPLLVVDTPGVGITSDALQALAIHRGVARWREADLQILVLDGADGLPDEFFERLQGQVREERLLVVSNKSDLPPRWYTKDLPAGWRREVTAVSARSGEGLPVLEQRLVARLALANCDETGPGLFTARQRALAAELLQARHASGAVLAERLRNELLGSRGPCRDA